MTKNQIDYWASLEKERANKASEAEAARANRERERETRRSNLTKEVETNRANRATEYLRGQEVAAKFADIGTKQRANEINALNAATQARKADIDESYLAIAKNDPSNVNNELAANLRKSNDPIDQVLGGVYTGLKDTLQSFLPKDILKFLGGMK